MQQEKTYTKKEVRKMQRDAYISGAIDGRSQIVSKFGIFNYGCEEFQKKSQEEAEYIFPTPKVTRNRTVTLIGGFSGMRYTVEFVDGMFRFPRTAIGGQNVETYLSVVAVLDHVGTSNRGAQAVLDAAKQLEDLKANPTETVDAE